MPEWIFNLPPEPQAIIPDIKEHVLEQAAFEEPLLSPTPKKQTTIQQESTTPKSVPFDLVPTVTVTFAVVTATVCLLLLYRMRRHGATEARTTNLENMRT